MLKRTVTAVILMPLVMMGILYLPPRVTAGIITLVLIMAGAELFGFYGIKKYDYRFLVFAIFLALLTLFLGDVLTPSEKDTSIARIMSDATGFVFYGPLVILGLAWWLMAPYFLWKYEKHNKKLSSNPLFLSLIIFAPACAVFSVYLADSTLSYRIGICYLLGMVWATDTGAYFVGKFFGKHRLAPRISPTKTIEGAIGGIVLSLIVTIVYLKFFHPKAHSMVFYLIRSVFISLWTIIGDLFESMLKRLSGVKDSGKLLPGHGGIYDRIDGLIAAIVISGITIHPETNFFDFISFVLYGLAWGAMPLGVVFGLIWVSVVAIVEVVKFIIQKSKKITDKK
jgi:phosphatidate cytidylyltransferase